MKKSLKIKLARYIPLNVLLFSERLIMLTTIFKTLPLRQKKEKYKPILIVGSGRSGNTLLRSLLVAGDQIAIPPESYVWPRTLRKYRKFSFIGWNTIVKVVVAEFEAYKEFYTWNHSLNNIYQDLLDVPKADRSFAKIIDTIYSDYAKGLSKQTIRWGDKTPINTIYLSKILKVFPDAQIIHIVRNPIDAVASYINSGLYSDVHEPTHFWNNCIKEVNKVKKNTKYNLIEIKYEDLVTCPEKILKETCDFLNVTFKDSMINFHNNFNNLGDTKIHKHHKNLKNPINKKSIGKGYDSLSKENIQYIEKINHKYMKYYEYL